MTSLPVHAYAAALAGLPNMTIHRLRALLAGSVEAGWAVAVGESEPTGLIRSVFTDSDVGSQWAGAIAGRHAPEVVWQRCCDLGVTVLLPTDAGYPAVLRDDSLPPPVLFATGDLALLHGRRAAIVGTRNATAVGRDAAVRFGRGLADAGVHVVSGLARGIDGHAHRGALSSSGEGRPIAIVGSGHDRPYPWDNRHLWAEVAAHGLLLSEAPPGAPPEAYRFPLRNRLIAALSEVLVVVESREKGGSLLTVGEANQRGVPVMAVPGGLANRAARGTNELIRDGAAMVLDIDDVLVALSIEHRPATASPHRPLLPAHTTEASVYAACAGAPRTLDSVALACSLSLGEAATAVARLEQAGWVRQADGWIEVEGSPR